MSNSARPTRTGTTRFAFDPPVIHTGVGCVAGLADEVDSLGLDSLILVCGRSVGSTAAVIEPIEEALGDRLVGIFDEASADKRLSSAWSAATLARSANVDGLVGVGGGSSLDVATVASALVETDHSWEQLIKTFEDTGRVPTPETPPPSLLMIPTTLAGAELSQGAGITASLDDGRIRHGGISDPRLRPQAVIYDAALVQHTPVSILRGSAMNGFNKGIEALYSPTATPVTDATAMRGLSLLRHALPALGEESIDPGRLEPILEGTLLAQYGVSRPEETGLSVLHGFGHGITAVADVQQGVAHAIMTPYVLRELFEQASCRHELIAAALSVDSASAVIETITEIRSALGLPTTLRSIDSLTATDLPIIAKKTIADPLLDNLPPGVSLSEGDINRILENAW